jgi:hypothetical protein
VTVIFSVISSPLHAPVEYLPGRSLLIVYY